MPEGNGLEAWRLLHAQCEPSVGMKEAQVMQSFTGLITHRAKNLKESRKLIAEMDQRARRVAEVTGKPVEVRHAKSVLTGIIDLETSKFVCSAYVPKEMIVSCIGQCSEIRWLQQTSCEHLLVC